MTHLAPAAGARSLLSSPGAASPLPVDAGSYLLDLVLTLHALATTWPPAAALLVAAEHGALLPLLAGLHDRLLPELHKAFREGAGEGQAQVAAQAVVRLRLLEAGVLQLCWQLLRLAYLTHDYLACPTAAQLYKVGSVGGWWHCAMHVLVWQSSVVLCSRVAARGAC
jgi:hypothetical protein